MAIWIRDYLKVIRSKIDRNSGRIIEEKICSFYLHFLCIPLESSSLWILLKDPPSWSQCEPLLRKCLFAAGLLISGFPMNYLKFTLRKTKGGKETYCIYTPISVISPVCHSVAHILIRERMFNRRMPWGPLWKDCYSLKCSLLYREIFLNEVLELKRTSWSVGRHRLTGVSADKVKEVLPKLPDYTYKEYLFLDFVLNKERTR